MYVDTNWHEHDHYRAIANELRLVVMRMKHAEAAEELRRLASNYESLADWHADVALAPVEKAFPRAPRSADRPERRAPP